MNYSDLKSANPRLFWDGICRGSIQYSDAGALSTGTNVTNLFVEELFGYPKSPNIASFNPNTSITVGPGNSYPKPWRSFSQFTQDASYGSQIGPFARIVKIPETPYMEDTCVDGIPQCGGSAGGIYGRLGVGQGGDNVLGFRAQNWYGQAEGTYNTAFFNSRYTVDWLSWNQWWGSASKATVTAMWLDPIIPFVVEVEVAYSVPEIGDDVYWPGPNLGLVSDASYELITAMVAIAAVARWVF